MKRNAGTFRIEPDGFSIHTFELSKKVASVYKGIHIKTTKNGLPTY